MGKKKIVTLSNGVRKHIRLQKAMIRKLNGTPEEQARRIAEVYAKFAAVRS